MTEDQLKEIISKGNDANEWLNHPTYKHVLTLIKAQLIREFEKTKFKNKEEREEIWRKLQSLNAIDSHMKRMIRDSERANQTLLERIKKKFN